MTRFLNLKYLWDFTYNYRTKTFSSNFKFRVGDMAQWLNNSACVKPGFGIQYHKNKTNKKGGIDTK